MRNVIAAVLGAVAAWVCGAAVAQPAPPDAQAQMERSCEAGDASACGQAAAGLIATDRGRAGVLLDRGCAGGDQRACTALGLFLVSGDESGRNYARAAPLLEADCEAGSGGSCASLANMVFLGVTAPADPSRALALAEKGCALDDARACAALGLFLASGDVVALDLRRAGPALVKGCAAAVPMACETLETAAVRTVQGDDPRAERGAGLDLFEAACTGKRPRACVALGSFLEEGVFGPVDPVRAAGAFERGCALDHAVGCASLAEAYRTGRGVSRDSAKARTLAEKALALEPDNADAKRTLRRVQ